MEILGYVFMLAVGLVLGLIGGGGAILTMPILVYIFKITPVLATSYSLFIVGCASAFGVWRYHAQRLVDYKTAVIFLLPSFFGTYLARQLVLPMIPAEMLLFGAFKLGKDQLVMLVFAAVMLGASISMIRPQVSERSKRGTWDPKLLALGFLVGFVAGFVGAGGGFLIIPALVILGGVTMSVAVPTSLLIITANSWVAFLGDLIHGTPIEWWFLVASAAMAAAGLFVGVKLVRFFSPDTLKRGFGWFVLMMGIWILGRQLW